VDGGTLEAIFTFGKQLFTESENILVTVLAIACIVLLVFVGRVLIALVKKGLDHPVDPSACASECNSHTGLIEHLDNIVIKLDELSLWIQKKNSEDVSEKQRRLIMRSKVMDVLPMFYDNAVKSFAVAKSILFIDFTLENLEVLKQENGYCLFEQMFTNKAEEALHKGEEILGEEIARAFYSSNHTGSVLRYLVDIKKIAEDETNDKVNRYFNLSILFMQEFLSQLNKIQNVANRRDSFDTDTSDTNIAREFQLLEELYSKENFK